MEQMMVLKSSSTVLTETIGMSEDVDEGVAAAASVDEGVEEAIGTSEDDEAVETSGGEGDEVDGVDLGRFSLQEPPFKH